MRKTATVLILFLSPDITISKVFEKENPRLKVHFTDTGIFSYTEFVLNTVAAVAR
jgi:hypothetical protein